MLQYLALGTTQTQLHQGPIFLQNPTCLLSVCICPLRSWEWEVIVPSFFTNIQNFSHKLHKVLDKLIKCIHVYFERETKREGERKGEHLVTAFTDNTFTAVSSVNTFGYPAQAKSCSTSTHSLTH